MSNASGARVVPSGAAGSSKPARERLPSLILGIWIAIFVENWLSGIAYAASSGATVSITFQFAPRDALRRSAIAPETVLACQQRQAIIDDLWKDKVRKPRLACQSLSDQPIIVSDRNQGRLIARP